MKLPGAKIIKLEIPTVCHQSLKVIDEEIAKYDPDVILSIGQAGGRSEISVERIGINIDDCRIPDNAEIKLLMNLFLKMDLQHILSIFRLKQWLLR